MDSKVKILFLPVKRWKEARALRLESLKNELIAFGTSLEEEKKSPKSKFVNWIKDKQVLYAESNGELIGLIGLKQSKKNRSKHVAEMGPLYVKREYRKAKIGSRLAKTAFKIAKQRGVEKIRLEVNKSNKPAVKFYKKMGFKKVGLLKKELKINSKYYDLIILEKRV